MKQFKDIEGRTWDIVMHVGNAKRVRDLTQVDLFNLYQSEGARVFSDPILLVNVIYVLCQEQATKREISDEEFGKSMIGDVLENAANALLEEVADFFPTRRRTIMKKTLEKSELIAKQMEAEALERLDKLDVTDLQSHIKSQAS